MKTSNDTKTADLLPNHDLAGEVPATPTTREKNAERIKRFRERHGVVPMTLNIDAKVMAEFGLWLSKNAKGRSKSAIVQRLIETQLLRKR